MISFQKYSQILRHLGDLETQYRTNRESGEKQENSVVTPKVLKKRESTSVISPTRKPLYLNTMET